MKKPRYFGATGALVGVIIGDAFQHNTAGHAAGMIVTAFAVSFMVYGFRYLLAAMDEE